MANRIGPADPDPFWPRFGGDGDNAVFQIRSVDGAGNVSPVTTRESTFRDAALPEINVTGGNLLSLDGEFLGDGETISVSVNARDTESGVLRVGIGCTNHEEVISDVVHAYFCVAGFSESNPPPDHFTTWSRSSVVDAEAPCVSARRCACPREEALPQVMEHLSRVFDFAAR